MFNHCAPGQKTQVTPTYVEEAPKTINEIYFKDGKVIQCDIVWEGAESEICCKKSEDILAYSAADVNLVKTFGETDGKDIAERYEVERKKRELMSTIFKPKQYSAEGEQLERVNTHNKSIELEKRWLQNKLKSYEEKYRKASGPPPKGHNGFNEKVFFRRRIESTEKKIEELERDPEYYFYKKNQQRAERSKRVEHDIDNSVKLPNTGKFGTDGTFYAPIGNGGLMNTKTGEIIN